MDTSFFAAIYQETLRAWPNRWLGFTAALALGLISSLVVIAMPDQYESEARVFVNAEIVLKPLLKDLTADDDGENRLAALRLFQSTLLSEQGIDSVLSTPDVGFDVSTPGARADAAAAIRAGVTIVEEQDNLFLIKSVDTNPARARNVVDGLLSYFIDKYIKQASADLQAAGDFLDKQVEAYRVKLLAVEAKLSTFRLTNAEFLGEQGFQTRLAAARTAVRDAQLQLQLAVELRDRIRAEAQSQNKPAPGSSPTLLATDQTFPALIARISALQTQLNQLLLQYTDRHPDVIATRREIAVLQEQFGMEDSIASVAKPLTTLPGQVPVAPAVASAAGEAVPADPTSPRPIATPVAAKSNAAAPISSIQMRMIQANFMVLDAQRKFEAAMAALKVIEQYSATAPGAEAEFDKLTREQAVLKENYDQLSRRRESARITQAAILPSGSEQYRVVERPEVAEDPAGPDRQTFLLLAAVVCVTVGAAIAYAFGLLRGTFVSAAEAERILGLPVIARLSNSGGILGRVSQSADTLVLAAGVAGIFVTAFILSRTMDLLTPVRAEIYRLLETDFMGMLGRLF